MSEKIVIEEHKKTLIIGPDFKDKTKSQVFDVIGLNIPPGKYTYYDIVCLERIEDLNATN